MNDKREKNIAIWEQRYSQHKSMLRYPEDIFVRVIHHYLKPDQHRRILDYGFGAGANMLHLLQCGFEVAGVEASPSAIEYVSKLTQNAGFNVTLKQSLPDGRIPFEDECFHGVIAWQVLYYNDLAGLSQAVDEINRVLVPGGIFLGSLRAPGDRFHTTAVPLGEGLYIMTVEGQEGATIIVPKQNELPKLLKRDDLPSNYRDCIEGNLGFSNAKLLDQLLEVASP